METPPPASGLAAAQEPITKRFVVYPSIDKPRDADVQHARDAGMAEGAWCATEKIHGANFSFITDGTNVAIGKRTSAMPVGTNFMGCNAVVSKYAPCALRAFEWVKSAYAPQKRFESIQIYGELFGGGYPCKGVKGVARMSPVQKGVYYCPQLEFYAYDIAFDDGTFVDYDVAVTVFERSGFFYAKVLATGSMDEMLAFNPHFESTIPAMFGLPTIADNTAEGVVIKRIRGSRPIFKIKDAKFLEVVHVKARDAKEAASAEVAAAAMANMPTDYVNDNRLSSVLSKGSISTEDLMSEDTKVKHAATMKLSYLLAKDAAEEWLRDSVTAEQKPAIGDLVKLMRYTATEVVRRRFASEEEKGSWDEVE